MKGPAFAAMVVGFAFTVILIAFGWGMAAIVCHI